MSNIDIFTPRGAELYTEQMRILISKYGGVCYPLDDDLATASRTGVVRELSGLYPGVPSGVTYYNQVTVSGTLSPDATGTYTVAGVDGQGTPYYYLSPWYLSRRYASNYWHISKVVGNFNNDGGWYGATTPLIPPAGIFNPVSPCTGTATVTAVPASGIYSFIPSGVTFGAAGPVLGGDLKRAAGSDGVAGKIGTEVGGLLDNKYFTFMTWVRLEVGYSTLGRLSDRVYNGQFAIYVYGVKIGIALAGNSGSIDDIGVQQTISLATQRWYHVCVTYNGTNVITYVDSAVSQALAAAIGTLKASSAPVYFGGRLADNARQLKGDLFAPAIIPAALSAEEIKTLYLTATRGD